MVCFMWSLCNHVTRILTLLLADFQFESLAHSKSVPALSAELETSFPNEVVVCAKGSSISWVIRYIEKCSECLRVRWIP